MHATDQHSNSPYLNADRLHASRHSNPVPIYQQFSVLPVLNDGVIKNILLGVSISIQ